MRMKLKSFMCSAFGCLALLCNLIYIWNIFDYRIEKPLLESMDIVTFNRSAENIIKYILIWTNPDEEPIKFLGNARDVFVKHNCPLTNCYVTSNRLFLNDIIEFDVIIFHGKAVVSRLPQMPNRRSRHQKYVFLSAESSDYYPVCDSKFDGYFNWTWTYKLDSDIYNGYIVITDNNNNNVIGPKEDIKWISINHMDPINESVKEKLMNKNKAAAWFVSNCKTPGRREEFVNEVNRELEYYGLTVDVFGDCGTKKCPRDNMEDCLKMIQNDYYFYFSFENSLSEDYVTEKLLHSLNNFAVPVVYGGANYSRFMPDGIYLNARKLGAKELVNKMIDIMNDKSKYFNFFRWHNHYSYYMGDEFPETDFYCRLCSKLNDKSLNEISIYQDFRKWWNPPQKC